MIARVLLFLFFLSTTGCSSTKKAEDAVRKQMIDPASTAFRALEDRNGFVCGEVNSRNRFGGYVGFRRFIYERKSEAVTIDPQEYLSEDSKRIFGNIAGAVTDTAAFDMRWADNCR